MDSLIPAVKITPRLSGAVWLLVTAGLLGAASFDSDVQPVLKQYCSGCHNDKLASGGLSVAPFLSAGSVAGNREGWEAILAKLRAGEMPPKGLPRPAATQMDALLNFVQGQFDAADRKSRPDPGRVTAHRLNRTEYANAIRDLLGVDYRVREEFPADDSGYGFDNIGDVLTVSPTLMQKYLSAAEQIAARAVGGDPLPKPGVILRRDRIRKLEAGDIQLKDIVDYDADYIVRANLLGHRGKEDKPVTLSISVDGKPVKTLSVPVQISAINQQGGATQRSSEEVRLFLTTGEHTFRAQFVNDDALQNIPANFRTNPGRNIFPDSIEIAGPFPSAEPHVSQKKVLTCDPASGIACVTGILTNLSHRAYRRPSTKAEVAELLQICNKAAASGYTPAQSLQFAIAMLVSPQFLFRIERDPKPGAVAPIGDTELASRLSFFLWSSIPDDELLRLGETGKLHQPEILDVQVKRMIADPKATAFAENFGGQWLQTRSLDAMKPDPKLFPEWTPELKDAMRTETRMFFEAVMREDRPIGDFIDGRYTFLNELLAKHYGIPGVTGPEFRRVELTTSQRSGVFTQASVLTVSSYPTRTSVVLRGKYLLETVLNAAPPPPPPDVPVLNEAEVGVARSLRTQMEQHRTDPSCAACHGRMDPLGFSLENYDATGKWRTQDGKFPIDPSGQFPNGQGFADSAGMKELLKDNMPQFAGCLAEKMLTYALGRGVESYDRRTVQDLVRQMAAHDYRMQSLILGIVHSAPFQQRHNNLNQATAVAKTEGGTHQ
jgi:hypothetical protein